MSIKINFIGLILLTIKLEIRIIFIFNNKNNNLIIGRIKMNYFKRLVVIFFCFLFVAGNCIAGDDTLKAGFIYVGPVGDYGWSHAHDQGRLFAEKQLPWLKTVILESVS